MRIGVVVGVAALIAGAIVPLVGGAPAVAAPGAPASSTPGGYTPVSATRLLDTRRRVGVPTSTPVAAGGSVTFTAVGAGIPSVPTDASAVVLNVTATGPTASGYLTAFAAGGSKPVVSNVNYVAGQTKPNLAIVPIGVNGQVTVYNGSRGSVHVLADLSGFYTGGAPTSTQQGAFGRVGPERVLDTRVRNGVPTTTPVAPRGTVTFQVEGRAGVPTDVAAVALNITATAGGAGGYLTAYASGSIRPATSVVNFGKGVSVPALDVVRTGGDGKVTLYNGSAGTVHLIADVQGYYTAGDPTVAGDYGALPPARAVSGVTVKAGGTYTASLAGRLGLPLTNVSTTLMTVTAAHATHGGYLSVYGGSARPATSSLNFAAGAGPVANLVATPTPAGKVTFYNGSSGAVQVYADVTGYVAAVDLPLPANVSTGHYIRAVSFAPGDFGDGTMTGLGCRDAEDADKFVLLDIGAQTNDRTGVALSVVNTTVTYPDLVIAIENYAQSYQACASPAGLTIAVGTNNEGDFTVYPAAARGADWANKVIDVLNLPTGITVKAANDIEGAFASTQDQAVQWVSAYLSNTTKDLIDNGSLDGCPDTYLPSTANCSFGWTQAKYLQLTHNGTRIQALPQIYTAAQARQWANLYRTSRGALTFAGSLTENAAGPCGLCGMVPPQGWAFLYHGLSTVSTTPSLPVAADLDVVD